MNRKATLIINRSDSKCFACGKPAKPMDKKHDEVVGYNPGEGCGIVWENVTTEYVGEIHEQAAKSLRPDLNFLNYELLLKADREINEALEASRVWRLTDKELKEIME